MSVLSRVVAPGATHDLAGVVATLFSNPERAAPRDLPGSVGDQLPRDDNQLVTAVAGRLVSHLAQYASATQLARLRHELAVMFMAYNQEASWRTAGRTPPVWEYLTHRHESSFLPPMVLVDPIAGYELPPFEFADRRVRRVFCLAGSASVILNDLYSEASILSDLDSLALRRFLADIWAWLGGNREWHSTTERYHGSSKA